MFGNPGFSFPDQPAIITYGVSQAQGSEHSEPHHVSRAGTTLPLTAEVMDGKLRDTCTT